METIQGYQDTMQPEPSIIPLKLKKNGESIAAFIGCISQETFSQLEKDIESFLHSNELRYFATLRFEKRKKDYLTGCYMAKSVVAAYLGQADLAKIEIESGVFNQPLVKYMGWDIPGVSLSHSDEWSVALSFPSGHPMALDIEKLDVQKLKVIESQMTKYEMDSLNMSGIDKSRGHCQIWTMKEALSKVLGCGLTTPFSVLEIEKPHFQRSGNAHCYFKNFGQYKCHSWIINGYALSIVLPKKTEINLDVHALFS